MCFVNYSKDVLYLVLSFCILWLTIFLTWFIYYLIKTVKDFYSVIKSAKDSVEQVENIVKLSKEKLLQAFSYISVSTLFKKIIKEVDNTKKKSNKK
jgi:hypothetical protein